MKESGQSSCQAMIWNKDTDCSVWHYFKVKKKKEKKGVTFVPTVPLQLANLLFSEVSPGSSPRPRELGSLPSHASRPGWDVTRQRFDGDNPLV